MRTIGAGARDAENEGGGGGGGMRDRSLAEGVLLGDDAGNEGGGGGGGNNGINGNDGINGRVFDRLLGAGVPYRGGVGTGGGTNCTMRLGEGDSSFDLSLGAGAGLNGSGTSGTMIGFLIGSGKGRIISPSSKDITWFCTSFIVITCGNGNIRSSFNTSNTGSTVVSISVGNGSTISFPGCTGGNKGNDGIIGIGRIGGGGTIGGTRGGGTRGGGCKK